MFSLFQIIGREGLISIPGCYDKVILIKCTCRLEMFLSFKTTEPFTVLNIDDIQTAVQSHEINQTIRDG